MASPENHVIVYNYKDQPYITSSFCGYDGFDLSKGVFIGNKIICPNCGSSFDVTNGKVEDGPSLRNIASLPMITDEEGMKVVLPKG
jgi:nitrite reductase/ring-hydroxylating ferredoxin subunit